MAATPSSPSAGGRATRQRARSASPDESGSESHRSASCGARRRAGELRRRPQVDIVAAQASTSSRVGDSSTRKGGGAYVVDAAAVVSSRAQVISRMMEH